jgi:arylsulfatase A-like enzyme
MWLLERLFNKGDQPVEEDEYLTDAFTREALDFIERKKDRPFFLYLPYNAPHTPLQVTRKYYERFPEIADEKERIYAAMVSAVDDGVGAILEKLKNVQLEDNTLVVFLSDNGCATYTGACTNDPLRMGKLWLLEGGTRIPFVMQWPGILPAGKVYREPVISLDLMTTFMNIAGVDQPRNLKLDGVNLIPYLTVSKFQVPHEWLFWRHGYSKSVRQGKWKLFSNKGYHWLYDLEKDIGEQTNLSDQNPEVLKKLLDAYAGWESEMIPPLWPTKREFPAWFGGKDVVLSI